MPSRSVCFTCLNCGNNELPSSSDACFGVSFLYTPVKRGCCQLRLSMTSYGMSNSSNTILIASWHFAALMDARYLLGWVKGRSNTATALPAYGSSNSLYLLWSNLLSPLTCFVGVLTKMGSESSDSIPIVEVTPLSCPM